MQNRLHVLIAHIAAFIVIQEMSTLRQVQRLVKHTQHLVQTVIDLTMQARNLYNNAVVRQTVYKRIRNPFGDSLFIIVVGIMMDIDDRLINVSYFMSKNIDGNHGHGIALLAVGHNIFLALILHAEILAKTQCLRL